MTGVGLPQGKSVISVQSKRLADDVNHVYDRQIMFTNKIQSQQGRIDDLMFRIAKTEKELVSFCMFSVVGVHHGRGDRAGSFIPAEYGLHGKFVPPPRVTHV